MTPGALIAVGVWPLGLVVLLVACRRAVRRAEREERAARPLAVVEWEERGRTETAIPLASASERIQPRRLPRFYDCEQIATLPCAPDREPWCDMAAFRAQRAAIRALPMTEDPTLDWADR